MLKIHRMNNIASVDLNLLVAFDAILRERSITLAAQRIGLSQPAMSSALGRLRRTFNDQLFVRTRDGMQPTPYAQLLAPPIQRACELIADSLQVGADFDAATSTRTFTLYMTDIGEAVFLPRLLGALGTRAPRVSLRVLRIPERGAHDAMAAGEVDVAVGLFPQPEGRVLSAAAVPRRVRLRGARRSASTARRAHAAPVRGDAPCSHRDGGHRS